MAFETHLLNETGIGRAKVIGLAFQSLLTELSQYCASGRELAIVKTKLEEACFWAKRAMAVQPENQVGGEMILTLERSGSEPAPVSDGRSEPELPRDNAAGD
jgi:hypothetical protein